MIVINSCILYRILSFDNGGYEESNLLTVEIRETLRWTNVASIFRVKELAKEENSVKLTACSTRV